MSINFVGSAVTPQLETTPDATVRAVMIDSTGNTTDPIEVPEDPAGSGHYPYTIVGAAPGIVTVQFTASGTVTLIKFYYIRFIQPMPPLATVGDYTVYNGPVADDLQRDKISLALLAVSEAVRAYTPYKFDGTPPEWLVRALCRVVADEAQKDPQLRSMTVGEYSETYAVAATGKQNLLPTWLTDMIDRLRQRANKGLGTISTTRGLERNTPFLVPTSDGGDPFLLYGAGGPFSNDPLDWM